MNKHDRMYIAIANNDSALIEFFNLPAQDPIAFALKIDDKYRDKMHKTGIARDMDGYGIIVPDFRE